MIQGPGQFAQALERLLSQQLACTERLATLLEQERQTLEMAEAMALDQITRDKPAVMSELEQLAREQQSLLAGLNFEFSPAGVRRALSWCDGNGQLAELQDRVTRQINDCRHANEQNGLMVQHRLGYVRRALSALHGIENDPAGVYGPRGSSGSAPPSRLLASG